MLNKCKSVSFWHQLVQKCFHSTVSKTIQEIYFITLHNINNRGYMHKYDYLLFCVKYNHINNIIRGDISGVVNIDYEYILFEHNGFVYTFSCSLNTIRLMLIKINTHTHVSIKDAVNTFYYIVIWHHRHMVKDNLESKRGNPLLSLHGLLFLISSKGSFTCTIPQTG